MHINTLVTLTPKRNLIAFSLPFRRNTMYIMVDALLFNYPAWSNLKLPTSVSWIIQMNESKSLVLTRAIIEKEVRMRLFYPSLSTYDMTERAQNVWRHKSWMKMHKKHKIFRKLTRLGKVMVLLKLHIALLRVFAFFL